MQTRRTLGQYRIIDLSLFALIMMLCGLYRIDAVRTDDPIPLVTAFFLFLYVAVGEEILFRGVLFRWIDEKWGFIAALVVSALLFGFMHLGQPGSSWWSSLAIAIEAGLLLGAAYKYSGTLWLQPNRDIWGRYWWNVDRYPSCDDQGFSWQPGQSLEIPE